MLRKTSIDAGCFVVTHWGSVSFLVFSNLWIHISGLVFCFNLNFPWSNLGVRVKLQGDRCVCKQDQQEYEKVQHLHCLFINHNDSPWATFAYLNVKIACVLRGASDSGCGFTSGHLPINSRTVLGLEKTQLGNAALSCLHVCAGIRERTPFCGADLHLLGAVVSLWGPPWLCEDREVSGLRAAVSALYSSGVCGCQCLTPSRGAAFKELHTVINHFALDSWLQNWGEAAYSCCFQNWKHFVEHGICNENRNSAYDGAYRG